MRNTAAIVTRHGAGNVIGNLTFWYGTNKLFPSTLLFGDRINPSRALYRR